MSPQIIKKTINRLVNNKFNILNKPHNKNQVSLLLHATTDTNHTVTRWSMYTEQIFPYTGMRMRYDTSIDFKHYSIIPFNYSVIKLIVIQQSKFFLIYKIANLGIIRLYLQTI